MNAVAVVKGRVLVPVRLDHAAGVQARRHGPDDAAAWRVVIGQNPVHQRHGRCRQHIPARLPAHLDIGPARAVGEYHDDRLGLLVHLVFLLPVGVAQPHLIALGEDDVAQGRDVVLTQLAQGHADIHMKTSRCIKMGPVTAP